MAAADAERLKNDPALRDVLDQIRSRALNAAIYDMDEHSREQGRQLTVAIDYLRSELQSRIDTAQAIAHQQRLQPTFE